MFPMNTTERRFNRRVILGTSRVIQFNAKFIIIFKARISINFVDESVKIY